MSDTELTSALSKALAPKQGMHRIAMPLESYQHSSIPLQSKRLLNLMAEGQPADSRSPVALISTPGLSTFLTVGAGPCRATNGDLPGVWYEVSGTHFYRVYTTGGGLVIDDLGDIGVPSGASDNLLFYSIAVGVTAAVVCVPPNAWVCSHVPGSPANILGGTFPGGVSSVAYLDGWFVFTMQDDPQEFIISGLLDPTDYDALDFASLDAFPNAMLRVVRFGTDLWFFGVAGIEIWYDIGRGDFPFQRQSGGVIDGGIAVPKAIAVDDDQVSWLSQNGVAYRSEGYRKVRISTYGIEEVIQQLGGGTAMTAFSYSAIGGHKFYVVNLPTRTLVYDFTTKLWHDRASSADGSGRWRPEFSIDNLGFPLLGDSLSGKLFFADMELASDDGVVVKRQAVAPPLWAGTNRAFCSRLEIEMEVGGAASPGDVTLDWSDDGGHNFTGGPRVMNAGTTLETRKRVFTTRLGSFHQRVFRWSVMGRATFYAVDADIPPALMGG